MSAITPARVRELRDRAIARASTKLPCESCGSTDPPAVVEPRWGSARWWDDPQPYVGCRHCGRWLGDLPSIYPYLWDADVRFERE